MYLKVKKLKKKKVFFLGENHFWGKNSVRGEKNI